MRRRSLRGLRRARTIFDEMDQQLIERLKDPRVTAEMLDVTSSSPAYVTHIRTAMWNREIAIYMSSFCFLLPELPKLSGITSLEPRAFQEVCDAAKEMQQAGSIAAADGLLAEVYISRGVDNFQCYLTDVLRSVFIARPETLRSKQEVTIEEVLQCGSISEFVARIAEKKADELTNSGFPAIMNFMKERLGVSIAIDDGWKDLTTLAIAIRNIIVHNRGYANERFLRLTSDKTLKPGERVAITQRLALCLIHGVERFAKAIDEALVSKFKLDIFNPPEGSLSSVSVDANGVTA